MTRLIRWGHLPDGRIAVLWADDATPHRTVVDGITLERIEGEPLTLKVDAALVDDLTRIQRGQEPRHFTGVLEPATSALAG